MRAISASIIFGSLLVAAAVSGPHDEDAKKIVIPLLNVLAAIAIVLTVIGL